MEEIKTLLKIYTLYSIPDKECYTYFFYGCVLAKSFVTEIILGHLRTCKASQLVYEAGLIMTKPNKDGTKTNQIYV